MLALWVKVRVKPERRADFLKAIEVDAIGSERDKPGCLCFNVVQDREDRTSTISAKSTATSGHRGASRRARLRGVARRRRHPRRPGPGDALHYRLPRRHRLLETQTRAVRPPRNSRSRSLRGYGSIDGRVQAQIGPCLRRDPLPGSISYRAMPGAPAGTS